VLDSVYYLKESGNAGAVLIMAEGAKPRPMKHRVAVSLGMNLSVGAKPRLIVNYVDEGNYFFAEWEKTDASNNGTLRLFRREGGSDGAALTTASAQLSSPASLNVCFDDESFEARLSQLLEPTATDVAYICNPNRFSDGDKAGVGNGAAIAVDFGEHPANQSFFNIIEKYPPKADCPKCICACKGYCIPRTLTATFTLGNPSGPCNSGGLHGYSMTLTKASDSTDWVGTVMNFCATGENQGISFGCTENLYADPPGVPGDVNDFILVASGTPSLCDGYFTMMSEDARVSTCSPLSLVFGPYPLSWGEGAVCPCCDDEGDSNTFYITITE
jgi:hypothetical protein